MDSIHNELKAIVNLNNQFIVKYLDHFIEGPVFGLVMAFCEVKIYWKTLSLPGNPFFK